MWLIDATLGELADRFGAPARVRDTVSAHYERCVLDVVLPDGTPAIVKGNRGVDQARTEVTALAAAGEAGVPVPTVLAHLSGTVSVLVLERLDGDWLSPDHPPSAWRTAGAALRQLHSVWVPGLRGFAGESNWPASLRHMVIHWAPSCRAAGLATEVIDRVRAAVDRLTASQWGERVVSAPAPVTLHGDCAPIHFRLNGDNVVGILDLGDACRGDPTWDIAVLTLRSPDRLPAVLDGYAADARLRAWGDHVLPTYQALRLFTEVGWLADHGYDPSMTAETATAAVAGLPRHARSVSRWGGRRRGG